jgi:hypothetical protein
VKVKSVLEELEIMLPKASESESDEESDNVSEGSNGGVEEADKGKLKKKAGVVAGKTNKAKGNKKAKEKE